MRKLYFFLLLLPVFCLSITAHAQAPLPITGTTTVCTGAATALTDATTGGTWSSSNTAKATVGSNSGIVTGVAAGTATITYTTAGGTATTTILVGSIPLAGGITGGTSELIAGTITLSDATSASGWITNLAMPTAMDNASVATVNDNIYVIGGQNSTPPGHYATVQIYNTTTNTWSSGTPMPQTRYQADGAAAINGKIYVPGGWNGPCSTTSIYIYDVATDSWTSGTGMPGLSAQGITGVINGKLYVTTAAACATGYQNYLYSYDPTLDAWTVLPSSPIAHANPAGGVINGKLYVAGGYSYPGVSVLSNQLDVYDPVANTWSTMAPMPTALFTMASGVINGKLYVAGGIDASSTKVSTLYVYDPVSDTWSTSTSMPFARGDLSGCVFNGSLYVLGGENGGPSTLTTNQSFTPYTWSSSNNAVATVDQAGNVTGIAGGTTTISYTVGGGCTSSATHTVAVLGPINGPQVVCVSSTGTLTDIATGGTWSSSTPAVATVSPLGIVTGVSTGTSDITYTLGGNFVTATVTVNPMLSPISGSTGLCAFSSITLSDADAGGTWSSGSPTVATIGSSSGIVTGVATGGSTIIYTFSPGCKATVVVTVSVSPSVIHGASTVCTDAFITLSNSVNGGIWSSSDLSIASIGSGSGDLIGVAAGTATISYSINSGCLVSTVITVNQSPDPITGATGVCQGATTNLTDISLGGGWSSSNTAKATVVPGSGAVSGVAVGTAVITYTFGGCNATYPITVNPLPASITGSKAVCEGSLTALNDGTINGGWSSASTTTATVGSGDGFVVGVAAGTTTISYTLPTGCYNTAIVTVNPLPASISGANQVCAGLTITLSDAITGGTWSSNNTGVSTVGLSTGVVTGVSMGIATITYKLPTGCSSTIMITVNPLPGPITGLAKVCPGLTTTLSDTTTGGTWASVGAAGSVDVSGIVSGISAGTVTVAYIMPATGCLATKVVTVNPLPATITGTSVVCAGQTTSLSDLTTGGTWSSGAIAIAAISSTGIVTGAGIGTATIMYQLATGCSISTTVTVNQSPAAITGIASICIGGSAALTDAIVTGTWSSSASTIATVDISGNVTSIATGTTMITYTLGDGCIATDIVTVYPVPTAITGTTTVCAGSSITLSDGVAGGSWSSDNIGIATISASGAVTGVSAGTADITYSFTSGCLSVTTITVNPVPLAITGTTVVCSGLATSLSDLTTSGTWTSGAVGIATVGSTGIVTGVAGGSVTISYSLITGCHVTTRVTVNPTPSVINGAAFICLNASSSLNDVTLGGTWSSGDPAIVSISPTGVVTGTGVGATLIYYTLNTGCMRIATVSVNPIPAPILGLSAICSGTAITLSDPSGSGTWTSGSIGIATVGSASGIVIGAAAGTVNITYAFSTGCNISGTMTVNQSPSSIFGVASVCEGFLTTLTDVIAGGVWNTSDPLTADVGPGNGIVSGIVAGTATISYTLGDGCMATRIVTVNTSPSAITGVASVCSGLTTTLSDAITGGTWSSSAISVATVGSSTGIVSGLIANTANITYAMPGGCKTSVTVTVNPLPSFITGALSACEGFTTTLNNSSIGGVWSSSNTSIATIGSTGVVTAISAGTTTITYMLAAGCIKTAIYTVNPLPSAITGSGEVCIGYSFTLSDVSSGGIWSSSAGSIANVSAATGLVTGVSNGTAIITYKFSTGCLATTTVTIDPQPSPIIGASGMCLGASITLGEAAGGAWSSGNLSVASVDISGVVTGISPGTALISYTLPIGCYTTAVVTVNPFAAPILGTTTLCQGATTSLSDATYGGVWSATSPAIATISTGGLVTGVTGGTVTVTYMPATGCYVTTTVVVNPLPNGITGAAGMCIGNSITLSDTSTGGAWSCTPAAASIISLGSATGIVTGVSAGTAHITYTLPTGCKITTLVTVNPLPTNILGALHVCSGATMTLIDATSGGTWSSSDTTIASIGEVTGSVQGVAAGVAVITYTLGTGCFKTAPVTVNPAPVAISGNVNICIGSTQTLSDGVSGGVWSTITSGVASVGSASGIVTGLGAGTVAITYSLSAGCKTTVFVTVNPVPAAILGTRYMCAGTITSLSDPSPLGTWSSGSPTIAPVDLTTGVVSGYSAGTATITYTLPAGCYTSVTVTVNPTPGPILGNTVMCFGYTTALTDLVTGGTWASSSVGFATVGLSTGVVTGVSVGSAIITYTLPAGCKTTATIVINTLPTPITGVNNFCMGSFTTFSDGMAGGIWTSNNTSVAIIGSGSGVITSVTTGSATISYTLSTGCYKTANVTVNPLPAAITGGGVFCAGTVTPLNDAATGGHWTSSNTVVATVSGPSGVLTALSAGTSIITYALLTGCMANTIVTVNPLPAPIIGTANTCAGNTLFLSDATAGGVWQSSNNSIGTVDAAGNVTTILSGRDTITYTLATGCFREIVLTVNPVPQAISGGLYVCAGNTITLSDGTSGGTWATSNPAVAGVGAGTGIVTGVAAGTAAISYILPAGCGTVAFVTVNPAPSAISGVMRICTSTFTLLTDAVIGGTWSSDAPAIAAIGLTSGILSGVSGGTANITYALAGNCLTTTIVTISPVPFAGTINGAPAVCMGAVITLSDDITPGSWSSSDTTIAKINASGQVAGLTLGSVTITYAVTQFCGDTFTVKAVQVNPQPYAAPITGNKSICINGATTLYDSVAGGIWSGNNIILATISSTGTVTGGTAGIVTIKYSVTNSCGTAVATTMVTINPFAALAPITIHPANSLCLNTEFQNFGVGVPPPAGIDYTWNAYNAAIYSQSPDKENSLISFPSEGTAIITLSATVLNTGCIITDSFVVDVTSSVSPKPVVDYYASEFVCTDNTADSYQWGYDDVVTLDSTRIHGETFQDYYISSPDFTTRNYWVMTLHNGCLQKSYYNTPIAGVKHVAANNPEILLYPNPADSKIYIDVKGINNSNDISVQVYDMLGKNIRSGSFFAGKGSVNISDMAPGVYSVMLVQNGGKIGSATFVKK